MPQESTEEANQRRLDKTNEALQTKAQSIKRGMKRGVKRGSKHSVRSTVRALPKGISIAQPVMEGKEVGNAGKSATESRCFRFGCVLCLRGADVPSLSRRFPSKSVISIIPDSGLFVLTERCDVVYVKILERARQHKR